MNSAVWVSRSNGQLLSHSNHLGTRLAVSGGDGTVRIYALPIEDLLALARARVTRSLTTDECRQYLHLDRCPDGQ